MIFVAERTLRNKYSLTLLNFKNQDDNNTFFTLFTELFANQ